ncbi:hypothetical protein J3704_001347 [Salmonella enterica subsp. diarizonae serovar 61:z52:z53]|nr:hypothetical protein [Salmonella enterica subsp. diarizonae serovar 61:z52:z53]EHG6218415.1 hypothetical protein [Salmonella enterica subsp. diarizonae serovar 61:z52:z53]
MQTANKIVILTNLLLASVAQPVFAAADLLQAVLWAYPSNDETTKSYEIDWAGLEYDLPNVNSWSWGRPYVRAVDCRVGNGIGRFNQDDYNVVAFPQKVQIRPGFDAIINVRGDYANASANGWNISVGYKKRWTEFRGVACAKAGENWKGNYDDGTSSGISQRIKFPLGIPAGYYVVDIPARVGLYSRYWTDNHKPIDMPVASMLSYLIPVETKVKIRVKVNNSCKFNTNGITLDHGAQILGIADKHEVSKSINVSCTGKIGVRLSLVSLSPPNKHVGGEYRAGLGNGWDSRLKLDGMSGPRTLQFPAAGAQTVQISSELVRGPHSDVGRLSGSAVLVMQPN